MNSSRILHQEAMSIAQYAYQLRLMGKSEESKEKLKEAFYREREAAILAKDSSEPTRSVLFRSAATLAFNSDCIRDAEEMVAYGLIGNPPDEIAEELRDLLEQVHFSRHLELRGVSLSDNEIQLSLAGPDVGFGVIKGDEFIKRYEIVKKMAYRVYERIRKFPFRKKGTVSRETREIAEPFLSLARASSYATTIRFGSNQNFELFETIEPEDIIREIIRDVDAVQNNKLHELREQIKNQEYFYNIVSLIKELAPDTESVHFVGITAKVDNDIIKSSLTVERNKINIPIIIDDTDSTSETKEPIEVIGIITGAEKDDSHIKITTDAGDEFTIIVPPAIMADIVRPYWDRNVKLNAVKIGKDIYYQDIEQCK